MPREFRRVPPNWHHPQIRTQANADRLSRLYGPPGRFEVGDYIPQHARTWPEGVATAYQFYESTTEGTPISPVCATLDEMAVWLVTNEKNWRGESIEAARRYIRQDVW